MLNFDLVVGVCVPHLNIYGRTYWIGLRQQNFWANQVEKNFLTYTREIT